MITSAKSEEMHRESRLVHVPKDQTLPSQVSGTGRGVSPKTIEVFLKMSTHAGL